MAHIGAFRAGFPPDLRHSPAQLQLTTDASRGGAQRFYANLGYTASHQGYKLSLA